jgi:formate dehydrogenase accessory protein FdhE
MKTSPWQRRIERAQELAAQHPFAAEILGFYVHLARFQKDLQQELEAAFPRKRQAESIAGNLGSDVMELFTSRFGPFLSVAESFGPRSLADLSRIWRAQPESWAALLRTAWTVSSPSDAEVVLAVAFLQPYAELLRSRVQPDPAPTTHALCPFCKRKPGVGVLRQMGEGSARSLQCSFCTAEWNFRRLICPGCGEENDTKLPVFTAAEFDYIRVECCDTCKTYLKTIELTKNGHAEPIVDELASAPLDLWARERGYAKLQNNVLGM